MGYEWTWIAIVSVWLTLTACSDSGRDMPAKSAPAASTPAVAQAPGSMPASSAAEAPLPAAIVAFRERRDACDHFRGEDAYDAKRAAFLAAEVARACTGTDKALADLRKRYANDARAMAALKDYEDKIE